MSERRAFVLDKYLITYDSTIKVETFDDKWYYGIIFYLGNSRYQLIHNYALGNRILISLYEGWCQDIPFKPATFDLLPSGVNAKEI